MSTFSVEVDKYNPMALAHCLKALSEGIPDFEYAWRLTANGGGIDYGVYLNIDIEHQTIEICNQPEYGSDGDDTIEDVIDAYNEEEGDEDDE